ncbi:MAG: hypothetical protein Q4D62_01040 [Planctomycetia bacterium]|nr:hypothetical protein [Planctomycetia bacterium]
MKTIQQNRFSRIFYEKMRILFQRGLLGLFFLGVVGSSFLFSQEKQDKKNDVPWVFIPLDEKGKPVQEEYYLPLEMFRNLYRERSTEPEKQKAYFFHSAVYQGTLAYLLTPRDLSVESMKVTFDVEVLRPHTEIHFPVTSEEVYLSPGSVRLNGTPQQVDWENQHLVLSIPEVGRYTLEISFLPILSDTGEKLLRNTTGTESGLSPSQTGFRFAIPAIANSRLELQTPAAFSNLEFPTAIGRSTYQSNTRLWTVQLGATPTLTVRWNKPYASAPEETLNVEELYWWTIEKDWMNVLCRYRFLCPEKGCNRLEWRVDSRLRLEPSEVQVSLFQETSREVVSAEGSSAVALQPEVLVEPQGNFHRITVTFPTPVQGRILVSFPLRSQPISGAGNYLFPAIYTEKTRVVKRWINIYPEMTLQVSLPENEHLQAVAIPEFLAAWNDFSMEKSDFSGVQQRLSQAIVVDDTLSANSRRTHWNVRVRPIPEISSFQETLSCLCDWDTLRVQYVLQAPFSSTIPALLHLEVPEDLIVEKVLSSEGYQQKTLRFSRISSQRLAIFPEKNESPASSTPTTFNQTQIILTGSLDIRGDENGEKEERNRTVPQIRLLGEDVRVTSRLMNLYRTDQVLVEWEKTSESPTPAAASYIAENSGTSFGNVRLVSSRTLLPQETLSETIHIRPNRPQTQIYTCTFLQRSKEEPGASESIQERWELRKEIVLNTSEGVLDELTIEIPAYLQGPFLLEPSMQYTLEPVLSEEWIANRRTWQGEGNRNTETFQEEAPPERVRMIIRPLHSFLGETRLTLSCELKESTNLLEGKGTLVRLPIFRFPGISDVQEEVVLPVVKKDEETPDCTWTTQGMIPVKMTSVPGEKPLQYHSEKDLQQVYRIVDKHFSARLERLTNHSFYPQVVWNIHAVLWNPRKEFLALTTLDLNPQMARTCIVRMDARVEPLEFRLNAQPVQIEEISGESLGNNSSSKYRYFRIYLYSNTFLQRLEILTHGKTEQLLMRDVPDRSLTQGKWDTFFQLPLPEVVSSLGEPLPTERGICFFYRMNQEPVRLWKESAQTSGKLELLTGRPLPRMELVAVSEILQQAKKISENRLITSIPMETHNRELRNTFQDSPETQAENEVERWFRLWTPIWECAIRNLQQKLAKDSSSDTLEYQKELETLREDGKLVFDTPTHPSTPGNSPSLQQIFVGNLPAEIPQTLAFDTAGASEFYLCESFFPEDRRPPFLFTAIGLLFLTIFILGVLFLFPGMLNEVRTSPFWLMILGILWILCGELSWLGYLLLLSGFVLLLVRLGGMKNPSGNGGNYG